MARTGSGLSLRAVAADSGVDHVQIWEFEHGLRSGLAIEDLAAIGAVEGMDVRIRAYPAGDAIRDAGQQRLLERLRVRLHPELRWRTEVPLPVEGDLRAWDGLIRGDGWRIAVEAETVLDDLQALERRLALKQRDGAEDHLILLVADTRRNRDAIRAAPAAFARFSRDSRSVLRALTRGVDPATSAILIL